MKLAVHDKKMELHILHIVKPLMDYSYIYNAGDLNSLLRERGEAMMKEIKESLEGMGNPIIATAVQGQQ